MLQRRLSICLAAVAACGAPPDSLFVAPSSSDASVDDAASDAGPEIDYLAMAPAEVACPTELLPGTATPARNVILIIGDGMGTQHLIATRARTGGKLHMESLGVPVFINTDSLTTVDSGAPTDSAASATAMATGQLVRNGVLSESATGAPLMTVAEELQAAGRAVGLVTTSYLYDATPMAFVTHSDSRSNTSEILNDLFEQTTPEVVMGGAGSALDSEGELEFAQSQGYWVVRDGAELSAWDHGAEPQLLGTFSGPAGSSWTMTPELFRGSDSSDPTLPAMTERALERLEVANDGFFLLIENEHIDEMGHRALAHETESALGLPLEVEALDLAVGVVIDWVEQRSSFEQTLVVVAADHETGGLEFDVSSGAISFSAAGVHTRRPVAVFAKGPGSEDLANVCSVRDIFLLLSGRL